MLFQSILTILGLITVRDVTLSPHGRAPAHASKPVARDFVSLGVATHFFTDYAITNEAKPDQEPDPNTFSMNLLHALRNSTGLPPQIRVGGTSGDRVEYLTNEEQHKLIIKGPPGKAIPLNISINERWFHQVFHHHYPEGTKFIFDVPLIHTNSSGLKNSLRAAKWAMKFIGKDRLAALEVGNEPDFYHSQCHRKRGYTVKDYVKEWKRFGTAIQKELGLSGKIFQGLTLGTFAGKGTFTVKNAFDAGINGNENLKSISQHHYVVTENAATHLRDPFMNHQSNVRNLSRIKDDIALTERHGVEYVLGESGMMIKKRRGDAADMESVLGSALRTVDYLLYCAASNVTRVHMQQGTGFLSSAWQPIQNGKAPPQTRPTFYGLKFAAEAIGSHKGPTRVNALPVLDDAERLGAYAIYDSDKLSRVAIVNMHMWNGTQVSGPRPNTQFAIKVPANLKTATMRRLTAPNGAPSHKNVTFGGVQWEYETKGKPKKKEGVEGSKKLTVGKDRYLDVKVPASEAVLIEFA